MSIPRQQVISFTVLAGRTIDLTTYTRYHHDKVVGVVLLPDKPVFGDTIFLEINKENILPPGFNAGLISFRQFLNKEMKRNIYYFEEWAKGSQVRIIYTNSDKRSVNIDLVLFTLQGNNTPITSRMKLQMIPVPYTGNIKEPFETRTKTDFYHDQLAGIFNDHFNYVQTQFDSSLAASGTGKIISDFLAFMEQPAATSATEKAAKKAVAGILKTRIDAVSYFRESIRVHIEALKKTLSDYLDDLVPEPAIPRKNLFALQECIEVFTVYQDNFQSLSTLEITVGGSPVYPGEYPIANIIPRYRRSFNETMFRCSMPVKEADIFIRFAYQPFLTDRLHIPVDFSIYFMYHQKVKSHVPNP